MHTVKYWDKKLLSLQRLADSVFCKVVERVMTVKNCK